MTEAEKASALAAQIKPLIARERPSTQATALARLMAGYLKSQPPEIRGSLLDAWTKGVREAGEA